ncbi:MAG: hypothetical protein LBQ66_05125 [Planctomycetaceae bacterium]|nr:hypothetical protein [Planctomycetaceae bacterium]
MSKFFLSCQLTKLSWLYSAAGELVFFVRNIIIALLGCDRLGESGVKLTPVYSCRLRLITFILFAILLAHLFACNCCLSNYILANDVNDAANIAQTTGQDKPQSVENNNTPAHNNTPIQNNTPPNNTAPPAVILNISLPVTGKSSHAIMRTLERTLADFRKSSSPNVSPAASPVASSAAAINSPESLSTNFVQEPTPAAAPIAITKNTNNNSTQLLPTIILQFDIDADQDLYGRGSSFGACYEIAEILVGERFSGIRTVAYFPQSVKGHALLIALACDERIAAEKAEIGEASIDEKDITKTEREAYLEISRKRLAVPKSVVEKMLDPAAVLLRVETEKGVRLTTPSEVDELSKTESFVNQPTVMIAAGEPGIFTSDTARKINLISHIANDRIELARGLGFRPDDIKTTPVPGELGHAIRVNINGPISYDKVGTTMRTIQAAIDPKSVTPNHRKYGMEKIGFICICIDSPGGDLTSSLNLATYLADTKELKEVWKVAYIPYQARADAALIALACDEIVLGQDAILGGDGSIEFSKEDINDAREIIRNIFSKDTMRSWSLAVGFIDREIEIFQAVRTKRPTLTDYFCDEELKLLQDANDWQKGGLIKKQGELFAITGGKGNQYFVDRLAKDFAEFKLLYGLEDDPLLMEPGWADQFIAVLSSPGMSAFLLMIVFLALAYDSTGTGIGALVAVMGLCLFFWLNFLGGTAGWLEVMIFVAGVIFVAIEIFVLPGFGIFGICGAIAIIISLVFATQTFYIPRNSYQFAQASNSLLMLCVSGAGIFIVGTMISRTLHKANKPKDTIQINEREKLANYDHMLGMEGKTITPLVPAGKAMINGIPIDVMSEGELIERNETVYVTEIIGYRVIVNKRYNENTEQTKDNI